MRMQESAHMRRVMKARVDVEEMEELRKALSLQRRVLEEKHKACS